MLIMLNMQIMLCRGQRLDSWCGDWRVAIYSHRLSDSLLSLATSSPKTNVCHYSAWFFN